MMIYSYDNYNTMTEAKIEVNEREQSWKCVICLGSTGYPMILVPCGHTIICAECSQKDKYETCPECRQSVRSIIINRGLGDIQNKEYKMNDTTHGDAILNSIDNALKQNNTSELEYNRGDKCIKCMNSVNTWRCIGIIACISWAGIMVPVYYAMAGDTMITSQCNISRCSYAMIFSYGIPNGTCNIQIVDMYKLYNNNYQFYSQTNICDIMMNTTKVCYYLEKTPDETLTLDSDIDNGSNITIYGVCVVPFGGLVYLLSILAFFMIISSWIESCIRGHC
jgi:hypothetical protein